MEKEFEGGAKLGGGFLARGELWGDYLAHGVFSKLFPFLIKWKSKRESRETNRGKLIKDQSLKKTENRSQMMMIRTLWEAAERCSKLNTFKMSWVLTSFPLDFVLNSASHGVNYILIYCKRWASFYEEASALLPISHTATLSHCYTTTLSHCYTLNKPLSISHTVTLSHCHTVN